MGLSQEFRDNFKKVCGVRKRKWFNRHEREQLGLPAVEKPHEHIVDPGQFDLSTIKPGK